jgi:hypothetical protein
MTSSITLSTWVSAAGASAAGASAAGASAAGVSAGTVASPAAAFGCAVPPGLPFCFGSPFALP